MARRHRVPPDTFVLGTPDYSKAFDNGFQRFLQAIKENSDGKVGGISVEEEIKQKYSYIKTIEDLYLQTAKECLAGNWSGTRKRSGAS